MDDLVKCFMLEETDQVQVSLRVFTYGVYSDPEYAEVNGGRGIACPAEEPTGDHGYNQGHDSDSVFIRNDPVEFYNDPDDGQRLMGGDVSPEQFDGDPRWPSECQKCHEPFPADAIHQVNRRLLYRRADTGDVFLLNEAPDGAMWFAWWMEQWTRNLGPDGKSLWVKCPGGDDWGIDGVASNCTLPDDVTHRCWMRHGTPPDITVDKTPEPPFDHTCQAGGGSIATPRYHGFLTNGAFTKNDKAAA